VNDDYFDHGIEVARIQINRILLNKFQDRVKAFWRETWDLKISDGKEVNEVGFWVNWECRPKGPNTYPLYAGKTFTKYQTDWVACRVGHNVVTDALEDILGDRDPELLMILRVEKEMRGTFGKAGFFSPGTGGRILSADRDISFIPHPPAMGKCSFDPLNQQGTSGSWGFKAMIEGHTLGDFVYVYPEDYQQLIQDKDLQSKIGRKCAERLIWIWRNPMSGPPLTPDFEISNPTALCFMGPTLCTRKEPE